MIKFSFPHLYYDNLTSVIDYYGATGETSVHNTLTGERYKGYQDQGSQFVFYELQFNTVIEYDHWIFSRADLIEPASTESWTDIKLSYFIDGVGWFQKDELTMPFNYADSYNQDIIFIKPDPTLHTSNKYRPLIDWRPDTSSKNYNVSNFQISKFFEFDENPKNFDLKLESNSSRFKTDGNAEHQVQFDLPSRTWTATFEAVTDAKLATFKRRVNQQLYDNQKAYCYLYDSSGRDELLGASLAHVSIESFQYTKIQSNYNLVNLTMREVIG